MKKIIFTFSLIFCSLFFSYAQTNFENQIKNSVIKLNNAETVAQLSDLRNEFVSYIAQGNKSWHPYYYTALAIVKQEKIFMRSDSKSLFNSEMDAALKYLTPILNSQKNNQEVLLLLAEIHLIKFAENRNNQSNENAKIVQNYLSEAQKINPNNPRLHLIKGELSFYNHQLLNKGDTGKESFATALKLFSVEKNSSTIEPSWGESEAKYYLTLLK